MKILLIFILRVESTVTSSKQMNLGLCNIDKRIQKNYILAKNHTRNRINFVSRYWRDNRLNRTNFADNDLGLESYLKALGFLMAKRTLKIASFVITPGNFSISHPSTFAKTKALTTSGSGGSNALCFWFNRYIYIFRQRHPCCPKIN